VRTASRELFTVMNDHWKVEETKSGLYELTARDGSAKLGPMKGDSLVGALAVISELEKHLREGR
jgi:hypothetical protein